MSDGIVVLEQEVQVLDRNSLYGASQKFSAYFSVENLSCGYLVPFNVLCGACQEMCCIDLVSMPGHALFWCAGEFTPSSPSFVNTKKKCSFRISYPEKHVSLTK